jgi:hypothetical protein
MKALHIHAIALALLILNTSCEKVILIDLNEADQKIVVDAIVSNDSIQNYVILSKSGGFYQSNDFEAITGANVTITDDNGAPFVMSETASGYYTNPNLIGQLKTTYNLEVITENQTITGSTYIPDTTHLDSLSYFLNSSGFGDPEWFVLMHWSDEGAEENFYRFKTTINGDKENRITLLDDLLINGIETQYPLFDVEVKDYDILEVEFIEIDKGTYNYLKVLGEIASGENASSAAPGNPASNLAGNALGFFGGYAITKGAIVIEP